MARLKVLSSFEVRAFETPPEFNDIEKKKYLSLSTWEKNTVGTFKTDTNKVGFILQLGYFKAKSRFFVPKKFHLKDIIFVCNQLKIDSDEVKLDDYLKDSFIRHQKIILKHCGFIPFGDDLKKSLIDEALYLTSKQLKSKYIFRSLTDFLQKKRIEIPTFNTISSIIIQAVGEHEGKLLEILKKELNENHKSILDSLLEVDESYKEDEKKDLQLKRYKITLLKKFNHSTKPGKIKENIDQLQSFSRYS